MFLSLHIKNIAFLAFIFLFFSFLSVAQQLQPPASGTEVKRFTLIYKLKPHNSVSETNKQQLQQLLNLVQNKNPIQKFPHARLNIHKAGAVDISQIYELEFKPAYSFDKLRKDLLATQAVAYVEPIYIPTILYQPNDPLADSINGSQYYLKKIQAYKGWDIQKGDSTIVIGILDTGIIFSHEDIKNKIKYNYADKIDGIDNDQDGFIDNFRGWDLADKDNDPNADANDHGVAVSGIAAAEVNNNKGMAGVAFNCKILPVKVFPSTARGTFAGYEGIVYAADHGCQVINLSWGGANPYSSYEQDIINYAAINKNVVIVAAAGNESRDVNYYPASYNNVISVTSSNRLDERVASHTFNNQVDLMAPGAQILTTSYSNGSTYAFGQGTSMASPILAGCAALVRKHFPAYSALQIAEQLRMTTDNIYSIPENSAYLEKLGRGRVNLYRALTETNVKSVRNTENLIDKGIFIFSGDSIKITSSFINVLAPTNNLKIQLTSSSPYVTIINDDLTIGALNTLSSISNKEQPFNIYIRPDAPPNTTVSFRYGFEDGSYSDFQYFMITVNPDFVTINTNDLQVTATSSGNLHKNGYRFKASISYKNGDLLLHEGGLMVGTPKGVSDNIRNEKNFPDNDFGTIVPIRYQTNPKLADVVARGVMQDSFPKSGFAGVKVFHRAYAWNDLPSSKFVIVDYKITNATPNVLTDLYAGLFADWDIGNYNKNIAAYDSLNTLSYTYDVNNPTVFAGLKLLTNTVPTHYALEKSSNLPDDINLADGFSDAEKYKALSNPYRSHLKAGLNGTGNDVSDVLGGKIPDLIPGESYTIAFAVIAGDNLEDLQNSAKAAQKRYLDINTSPLPVVKTDSICSGVAGTIKPAGGKLFNFYADREGKNILATGSTFTTPKLTTTTEYYVSNIDSMYASPLVPAKIVVYSPKADFTYTPNPYSPATNGKISFTAQTPNSVKWQWHFGNGQSSELPNPNIQYQQPGSYEVKLVVIDKRGCTDSITKKLEIKHLNYTKTWTSQQFTIYPNPTPGKNVYLAIAEDVNTTSVITIEIINIIGEVIQRKIVNTSDLVSFDTASLARGMYLMRISGKDGTITKKFQVMRAY
ncbi:S8 family serine peptidase [Adhaeribacter aquaticus]|uniref:S8 family serine peptidase n=1 Tax=Adhaeribacter aquaticus TaxID=299567 RepID=UPI0004042E1B|nr:S8 family serine peptidase [Adhaeribacter aquaticus]